MKKINYFSLCILCCIGNFQSARSETKVFSNYTYDADGKIVSKVFKVNPPSIDPKKKIQLEDQTILDPKNEIGKLLSKKLEALKSIQKKDLGSISQASTPVSILSLIDQKIDVSKIVPQNNEFYIIPDNSGEKLRLKCLTKLKFKWNIFLDEEYTYFVFNQIVDIKLLSIPNIPIKDIISSPEILSYPKNTILRVKLKPGVKLRYSIENDEKYINISHFEESAWNKNIDETASTPVKVTQKKNGTIAFENLEKGEMQKIKINNQDFVLILTQNPDQGSYYQNLYRKVIIQPTFQGLCLKILGLNHKINFTATKGILNVVPTIIKNEENSSYKSSFETNEDENYSLERFKLLDRYISHYKKMTVKDIFKLAFIDLQLELGYEAIALLESEAKNKPFIINNRLYYFYLGMAHFINKEPEKAIIEWKKVPLYGEDDIWYRMALCEMGNPIWCFHQMPKMISILPKLQTGLRQNIGRKAIDFFCKTGNFEYLELLKKTLKDEKNYFIIQWLELLHATDLYFKKNYFASKQILEQIKRRKEIDFSEAKFDAVYQYVDIHNQLEQKNINEKMLMENLSLIHRTWSSDSFGYHLKKRLLEMNVHFNNPRSALHHLSFLKEHFPTEAAIDLTDKKIIQIVFSYIKNRKNYSPLKVINIFKTFENIINLDENRFDILDEVAKQYVDLNLLQEAVSLMNQNLNDIQNDVVKKIDYSLKIAKLYEQLGETTQSIKIYDSLMENNTDLETQNRILTRKIKALLKLKDYPQILKLTENRSDPEFIILKSSVYFEQKEWEKTITLLEELILRLDPLNVKSKKVFVKVLNHLAFSYFMTQQKVEHKKNELKRLKKKHSNKANSSPALDNLNKILKNKYKALQDERKKMNKKDPDSINYFEKLEELGKKYGALMEGQEQFLFLTRSREKKYFDRLAVENVLSDAKKMETYFFKNSDLNE
ncbi:MAG: hypothetical protein C0432_02780 [Candidatus Puniceispirillum sp.]|nr:hypothetical protein [Candidatus Pelagibacter sp.]MBA4283201.1 hypothetical protein [Candidatus Puniceispirillum sp.]